MYLKRIELIGFKSFADRTELEFVPGVTAIVGPNGSGKSNISDAVRWVLGEQSAKSLRGSKMEDVIFAGSDTRRPVNYCEVSLTLDNSDRALDIDYSEVTVTRRVYRSGESEYYINKQNCRLKDITELFMDTGVGKEAYSIIGQGRVEEILSTKAEDRRGIFEEAAGIVKYKARKKEAEKKLQETEQNLLRVSDIIGEIEGRIGPLQDQADKAKKFQALQQELKRHEVALYVHAIEQVHRAWVDSSERVKVLSRKQMELAAVANRFDAELEKLRLQDSQLDQTLEELQNALLEVSEEAEKAEGQREVLRERLKNLAQNRTDAQEQTEKLQQKKRELSRQLEAESRKREETAQALRRAKEALQAEEKQLAGIAFGLEEEIEQLKSDYIELVNEMASTRNEIRHHEQSLVTHGAKLERLRKDAAQMQAQEKEVGARKAAFERELAAVGKELDDSLEAFKGLMLRKRKSLERLEAEKKNLRKLEQTLEALRSRRDLLKEMQGDFSGFFQGVKEILKARERGLLQGVHGAVAELITVPQAYETAIEIALGSALQHVVVDDEETARNAIQFLKANQLGRATFLPLSVMRTRTLPASDLRLVEGEPEFVGVASSLVRSEAQYTEVIGYLLGTVVVARTLEAANRLARLLGYRYRVVTLEGDVVNAGGAMTGGSLKQKANPLLGRNRQLEELERKIREQEEDYRRLLASLQEGEREAGELEKALDEKRARGEHLRLKEQELKGLINQALVELRNIEEKLLLAEQEQRLYEKERQETGERLQRLREELKAKEQREKEIQAEIARKEALRKEHELTRDEKNEKITEWKVTVARIQQEFAGRKSECERLQRELEQVSREERALEELLSTLEQQIAASAQEEAEFGRKIEELRGDKEKLSELIRLRRQERARLAREIERNEIEARRARKDLKQLEEELRQEEVKVNRFDVELDNLFAKLREEYALSYERAKEKFPPPANVEETKRVAAKLKGEIAALGTVNLGAIEEYERLSERLRFLKKQQDDLHQAKRTLYQVIAEMEEEMAARFKQTFEAIRRQFHEVFGQLFGGGRADLQLSNPDDVLETGVDIVAQPPGKKLQHLALLSGGERALTAIALLFAILKVKPVPFCILDEVEAALDEANVYRFAEYLRAFSSQTQFIVVTHRKGTMEGADVLYGVTMQESGVSKLVSVRLEDKEIISA
ncbi:chromosome segregation protein SMC [Bacillaceae bacterium]